MEDIRVHVPASNLRELGGYQTKDGLFQMIPRRLPLTKP